MDICASLDDWNSVRAGWGSDQTIGFVPTMGFLHAGHLALVQAARAANQRVAVSIFVNPLQFGPTEDFTAYPRDMPRDLALLAAAGVDAVFVPPTDVMYPAGFVTAVKLTGPVVERLEGARRPGHFAGVATVVTKLFNIVRPTRAYFGQKDAQQVAVVRQFVRDLAQPLAIEVHPIVRELDGLALSSRNIYLAAAERQAALILRQALVAAQEAIAGGEHDAEAVRRLMARVVAAEPLATLDYADVVDPATFAPLTTITPNSLLPIVAKVGKPRLLDNFLWRADGSWDMGVTL